MNQKISKARLKSLCETWFGDMVKVVVDIEKECAGIGGDLHADAELLLLQEGSGPEALWGINFYPWHEPDKRIEYTALINIRPHQDNPSMEILDEKAKEKVRRIIESLLLGADEKLV
ncbi:hypothetical protein JW824_00465 [bacterium]|nr:hypothetical protein [bacterium]RQV99121.1 MAG: hypothetical protein EH221_00630 [bacterium]